uniref:Uncharacterized protein n=1 Tax=Amblyomma aureolatum TaxID=187763 RepID=A0A1E1XE08_9ACAR
MMSHLLRKSFKSHRRTHSTPPGSMVTATDKNTRNTLPLQKAALIEVPEHEELRSAGTRHGSLGFDATTSAAPRSVDEAKIALAKSSAQTSPGVSLPKNRDWIRIQQTIRNLFKTNCVPLELGEMTVLHEKIRTLSSSKAGPFLFDSFKRELEVCFTALLQRLQELPGKYCTECNYQPNIHILACVFFCVLSSRLHGSHLPLNPSVLALYVHPLTKVFSPWGLLLSRIEQLL